MTLLFVFFNPGKGKNINVGEDVNATNTSKRQRRARSRPRKRKVVQDINQVVKALLNDLELSNSEGEDLWYDDNEVTKEKDGMTHWWEKVDLDMPGNRAEFGDKEPDDLSDDLRSMDGSDSDNVTKKKRYRQFKENFEMKIPIEFRVGDQFRDMHVFKEALKTLAMQQGFDYIFKHNDTSRVSAICRHKNECD